jgi:hypothetical protein
MTHALLGSPAFRLHIQNLIEITGLSFILGASVTHPVVPYSLRISLAGPVQVLFDRTGRPTLLHCRPEDCRYPAVTPWNTIGTEVRSVKSKCDVDSGYIR